MSQIALVLQPVVRLRQIMSSWRIRLSVRSIVPQNALWTFGFVKQTSQSKALFKCRSSHAPNLMQMCSNKGFCSFIFNSVHENSDVWNGPNLYVYMHYTLGPHNMILKHDTFVLYANCGSEYISIIYFFSRNSFNGKLKVHACKAFKECMWPCTNCSDLCLYNGVLGELHL